MKKLIFNIFLISLGVVSTAQTANNKGQQVQSFIAGGVPIKVSAPDTGFVEVGSANRESVEIFVPPNNRLMCAFVLENDLPNLFKEGTENITANYALVEVPRRGENIDCEAGDFIQVTQSMEESLGSAIPSLMNESEDIFNNRLKSLGIQDMKLKIGEPKQLGCFFSKQDAFGLGILMGYEMGGSTVMMGATLIIMRVKKRLLFVYLYSEYKNDDTIKWLRKVGEKWSDEILKINKL